MALTVKDSTGAAQTLHTDTTTEAGKHIAFHHVVSTPNAVADAASLGASDRYTLLAGNNGGAAKALATDASGHLQVDIAADSAGIATAANQTTINTSIGTLSSKVTACDTGAVTISAALPAGSNNIGDVDVLTLPALAAGTNNIGDVDVATLPGLPATVNHGSYTLAGSSTAYQLSSGASVAATEAVQVKAGPGNSGTLHIGGSGVNATGWPLAAGDQVTIITSNVQNIYCWGTAAADVVHWLAT